MSFSSPPDWVKDAIFYQVFPERFENGDPSNDPHDVLPWGGIPKGNSYFGGDLSGIIKRIPYLSDLGINTLYLNPIFEARSTHKYNTKDYSRIDPTFGTNELFDNMTRTLKSNGIRTVLDGVFNHVGTAHDAFSDVVANGASSKFASWFNIFSYPVHTPQKPNYECWWGYGALPKLMVSNPEVKKYLFDMIALWTGKIDGWRLDVPNELPHEFWKEFRQLVRTMNPECYIVGELWDDASSWLQGDEFDATMNYRFRTACLDYFAYDTLTASKFDHHLQTTRAMYSYENNLAMQNLLGSHDTERFLTLCKGEVWRLKLAAMFQMTYLGAPMIYYGDEIGMKGGKDPDCRRCMIWDEKHWEQGVYQLYKSLITIRHNSPALRRGSFETITVDDKKDLYIFARRWNGHSAYVGLNKKRQKVEVTIPVHNGISFLKDELTGETFATRGELLKFTIPGHSARIFLINQE